MTIRERPIRSVLFDKDGTLFDFHATWAAPVTTLLRDLSNGDEALATRLGQASGFDLAAQRFIPGSPIVADSGDEIARILAAQLHGVSAADVLARYNAQSSSSAIEPALVNGFTTVFDQLKRAGLACGVATHDSELAARTQLSAIGALDRFAFIAGYDSGYGLKPDSGMLDAFCAAVGVNAHEVAVVGDSLHDLFLGRRGGAGATIAVLTGPSDQEELAPHADLVLESIADLPSALGLI